MMAEATSIFRRSATIMKKPCEKISPIRCRSATERVTSTPMEDLLKYFIRNPIICRNRRIRMSLMTDSPSQLA